MFYPVGYLENTVAPEFSTEESTRVERQLRMSSLIKISEELFLDLYKQYVTDVTQITQIRKNCEEDGYLDDVKGYIQLRQAARQNCKDLTKVMGALKNLDPSKFLNSK